MANDSFEIELSAIPEFPTIIAAIVTMALCAIMYLWMRKRSTLGRMEYVKV